MESLHEINRKNIEDLVSQHIEMIKLAKLLPKYFTVVFFGQFLYSASMISFLGFQIATVSNRKRLLDSNPSHKILKSSMNVVI